MKDCMASARTWTILRFVLTVAGAAFSARAVDRQSGWKRCLSIILWICAVLLALLAAAGLLATRGAMAIRQEFADTAQIDINPGAMGRTQYFGIKYKRFPAENPVFYVEWIEIKQFGSDDARPADW